MPTRSVQRRLRPSATPIVPLRKARSHRTKDEPTAKLTLTLP